MATEGNGGLGSSEEVREGQLMDPALKWKQMHGLDRRNLQLRFHQSMFPDSFFTERNVEGQDGAPIHVKLIDTSTGDAVRSGPLSCVKLKVVVVEGDFNNEDADDWTREDFERRVVKEREGKRPLLIGNLSVSLEGGVGSLGQFSFTDNSSWTRSKKFRLGLKVALDLWGGIRVREAITNPFAVKDRRGKVYEKHYPPALDDEVWRLESIGKNGPFHTRLDSKGISKVKDFLWKLGTDAQGLRKILGSSMNGKTWDTLVEHAKTCDLSGKYHVYYADETKNSGVVFKNIYELCGLIEGGKYYSAETLSDSQEVFADTLKKKAYAKWKDVVEYDGLLPLEMNPSKRARSSQTEVVAPESCPSDTDQRVSPAFLTHVAPRPGLVNSGPAVGDDFCNHTVDRGSSSLVSENYEYGSSTAFSSIGDMVSVPSGKYYVYYADNAKNYGVVFKIMSELYGLIEGGEYNSAETLSDSQKVLVDMLVKNARENSMHVVEYDDRMLLNMKQSKRASSSRSEVVIEAPQVSLPPLPSFVPLEQTSMNSVVVVGAEEQHVTRALDDDIFTLNGIGKDGPFLKKLKAAGISQVKDWKLGLDPEGLRKILGKTVSDENWKTLGDHANESVPRGKSHVYYADETKNSGVVFKNMAKLCGLIERGESYSAKTLSDEQKLTADTLKKEAGDKWKDIVEYDGLQPLEMNPSERARSSQTDVVTGAPDSSPSSIDPASSSYVDPPVNPGLHIGARVPCQPPSPSVPSGEAYENSTLDFEDFISCLLQDEDSIDVTSLLQQDLSEKADGNTSLDAFLREADRSDSHLPGSSLDPPEQADGNAVLSVGAHGGSFEQGGGSYWPWIYDQEAGNCQYRKNMYFEGGYYGNGNGNVQFGGNVNRKIAGFQMRRLISNFGGLSVGSSSVL